MDEPNAGFHITGWVMTGVATIISTLTGTVAMFYRTQISDYKANIVDLKDELTSLNSRADLCENEREALKVRCAVLEDRMEKIEKKNGN